MYKFKSPLFYPELLINCSLQNKCFQRYTRISLSVYQNECFQLYTRISLFVYQNKCFQWYTRISLSVYVQNICNFVSQKISFSFCCAAPHSSVSSIADLRTGVVGSIPSSANILSENR